MPFSSTTDERSEHLTMLIMNRQVMYLAVRSLIESYTELITVTPDKDRMLSEYVFALLPTIEAAIEALRDDLTSPPDALSLSADRIDVATMLIDQLADYLHPSLRIGG
jgi:hypothetical protein